jgi:hypothetical protein
MPAQNDLKKADQEPSFNVLEVFEAFPLGFNFIFLRIREKRGFIPWESGSLLIV